ncbi:MAG: hypothetical protein AB7H88_02610 [Vicinamibacterales bacterium]
MSGRGFTLVELLVASLIVLAVGGVAAAVVRPTMAIVAAAPASGELTARGRVALERLARDLRGAGAGAVLAGPAPLAAPPVVPIVEGGEVAGVILIRVPWGAPSGRLAEPVSRAGPLVLDGPPRCSGPDLSCGFAAGDEVLVADGTTAIALAGIASVQVPPLRLVPAAGLGSSFDAGAWVARIERVTYRLERAGGAFQLTRAADDGAPQPIADEVVSLRFRLAGDAAPSTLDVTRRRATYGPPPPPPGVDDPRDGWGAGENCLFAVDGAGHQAPRLASLGPAGTLAVLEPAMLADGPWCPDAVHPDAFDADLLRIRRVDVVLRLRAGEPGLRLPGSGAGGGARPAWVPDLEMRLAVALRAAAR